MIQSLVQKMAMVDVLHLEGHIYQRHKCLRHGQVQGFFLMENPKWMARVVLTNLVLYMDINGSIY